jgi:hypothetical protein
VSSIWRWYEIPTPWFAYVATMLLGELNRREPHLFDKPLGQVVAKI